MIEPKKKRRLRSVILVSAVGAIACGGKAADSGEHDQESPSGDGDGDMSVGVPIGDLPCPGTGGCFLGVPGIGGHINLGTGGVLIGVPPLFGTGGAPIGDHPEMGGMGGATDNTGGGLFIGIPR